MSHCFPIQDFLWDHYPEFMECINRVCIEFVFKAKKKSGLTVIVPDNKLQKDLLKLAKGNKDDKELAVKHIKYMFLTPCAKSLSEIKKGELKTKGKKNLKGKVADRLKKVENEDLEKHATPVCIYEIKDKLPGDDDVEDKKEVKGQGEIPKIDQILTSLVNLRFDILNNSSNLKQYVDLGKGIGYDVSLMQLYAMYKLLRDKYKESYNLGLCIYAPSVSPLANLINLICFICPEKALDEWNQNKQNLLTKVSFDSIVNTIEDDMAKLDGLVFQNPQEAIRCIMLYKTKLENEKVSPTSFVSNINNIYKQLYNNNSFSKDGEKAYPDFAFGPNGKLNYQQKAHIDTIYYYVSFLHTEGIKFEENNENKILSCINNIFKFIESNTSYLDIKKWEVIPFPTRPMCWEQLTLPIRYLFGYLLIPITSKTAQYFNQNVQYKNIEGGNPNNRGLIGNAEMHNYVEAQYEKYGSAKGCMEHKGGNEDEDEDKDENRENENENENKNDFQFLGDD